MFILVFLITILILVLVHELGHFIAAKRFNIKVLEFGFGLPPRFLGKRIGETIYSLNWLPFGGFVRLLGEDETEKTALENERSFAAQKVAKRIVVVASGVVMNLILAWILFWIVLGAQNFKTQIPLLSPHRFVGVTQIDEKIVLIGEVTPGSPAKLAGIASGDRVIAFNDSQIEDADQLVKKTQESLGKKVKLTLSDPQKTTIRSVEVIPRENPPPNQGALGVSLGTFTIANLNYSQSWQKLLAGPIHGFNLTVYSWEILSQTVAKAIKIGDFTPVSQNVAGPVGITSIVKNILSIKNPLIPYLDFMAALSLNLAIVNILPFPGLDGGRLLFLVTEGLTRRRTHPTLEKYLHAIGLAILLSLIFLVTISDIRKLIF